MQIMSRHWMILAVSICAPVFIRADAPATPLPEAAGGYGVSRVIQVGGEGRWDFITVDPATKLLYVPRQTHTQVISIETGKVVGDLKDTPGVHGVAIAPDLGRGFTSNGRGASVTVFDLKTLAVLGTVPTGQNPDAILYDPASKKIFVCNGRGNSATVIDAAAAPGDAAVSATIPLGGKPEVAVSDEAGHVYVNLEDKSSVVAIDTKTLKVTDTWKIEGGEEPSGLAIDIPHHRLFSGCGGNNVMAVLDTQTGKTLATVPIGKGVDGCAFDPAAGEAFASCGDGTLTVVKETSPGKFQVVQTVPTRQGAKTICVDPLAHAIYLPTADFAPAAAGERRPAAKPDSFMIVVVSRAAR